MLWLLKNPKKAREMGGRGKETVRKKFLMTRLVLDEIRMAKELLLPRRVSPEDMNRLLARGMRSALRLPRKSLSKALSLMRALSGGLAK